VQALASARLPTFSAATSPSKPAKQVHKPHPNVITAANGNVVQVDFKKRRVIVRGQ
jgi:hypothetical protein